MRMTISHINNDKTINDEHILAIYKNGYIIYSYLHIVHGARSV